MRRILTSFFALLAVLCASTLPAVAALPVFEISIKDHRFEPEELVVPAGQKFKLLVHNLDPTPEEFESHDFNREKVIGGGKTGIIFIGPLKPGTYEYFGEFNMDTALGRIIAE